MLWLGSGSRTNERTNELRRYPRSRQSEAETEWTGENGRTTSITEGSEATVCARILNSATEVHAIEAVTEEWRVLWLEKETLALTLLARLQSRARRRLEYLAHSLLRLRRAFEVCVCTDPLSHRPAVIELHGLLLHLRELSVGIRWHYNQINQSMIQENIPRRRTVW